MFCGNCGNPLPEHAKFCSACGQKVIKPLAGPEAFDAPEPEAIPVPPAPEPVFEEQEPEPAPVFEEPEPAPVFEEPEPEPVFEEPDPAPVFEEPERPADRAEPQRPEAYGHPLFEDPEEEPIYERRPLRRETRPMPPYDEPVDEPAFRPQPEPELPAELRPMSPWAYFGYGLLFLIPVVGLVLLIVFSFSNGNVNRRNFARSYWCSLILVLAIVLIVLVLVLLGVLKGPINAAIEWIKTVAFPWILQTIG